MIAQHCDYTKNTQLCILKWVKWSTVSYANFVSIFEKNYMGRNHISGCHVGREKEWTVNNSQLIWGMIDIFHILIVVLVHTVAQSHRTVYLKDGFYNMHIILQ